MKTYRSARALQAEIEQVLGRRPATTNSSPLDEVAEILSSGRHYAWIGIYLVAGERRASGKVRPASVAESKGRIVIPIRLGQNELGALEVESAGEVWGAADRILLKRVAGRLAKYLHGPGRYLVRKAREAASEQPATPQSRGYQPESEKTEAKTRAAAGEGRR